MNASEIQYSHIPAMEALQITPLKFHYHLTDLCRICLSETKKMIDIFDESIHRSPEDTISYKIYYCTDIKILLEDGMPLKICVNCHTHLESAYFFKKTCCESDKTLKALNRNVVEDKTEISDEDKTKIDIFTPVIKIDGSSCLKDEPGETINGYDDFDVTSDVSIFQANICNEELKNSTETTDMNRGQPRVQKKKKSRPLKNSNITGKNEKIKATSKKSDSHVKNEEKLNSTEEPVKTSYSNTSDLGVSKMKITKPRIYLKKMGRPRKRTDSDNNLTDDKNKEDKKQFCRLCLIWFDNAKEKYEHRKEMHTPRNIICQYCGAAVQYTSMRLHLASHKPPMITCDICGYKACTRSSFNKHILTHTGAKDYKCEACGKAYRTSSSLRAHARMTHLQEKKYACEHCGKRFFDRQKLVRHTYTHTDFKQFTCDVCGMSFSRRYVWVAHAQRAHNLLIPTPKPGRKSRFEEIVETKPLQLFN